VSTLIRHHIYLSAFLTGAYSDLLFKGETNVNLWHEMKSRWDKTLASQPRWDRNRLAFTINTEGKRIPCAISRSALQNLSRHTHLATSDLPVMDSRDKIEEIAARIFHITPEWVSGPVSICADEIEIMQEERRLPNPPPARAFAPREVAPFAIDAAAPAGSRAFQASGPYPMIMCGRGRNGVEGRPNGSLAPANPGLVSPPQQRVNMPYPKMMLAKPLSVSSVIPICTSAERVGAQSQGVSQRPRTPSL